MSPLASPGGPSGRNRSGRHLSVLMIRHGQSEWNLSGRWQGQADPPLTDLGRSQARAAARALGEVDAIWASDLQRAAETAAIIGNELGVGPVVLDPGIRERDVGEWSGLTRAEIDEQYPGYLPPPGAGTGYTVRRPPSWESDESVITRVSGAFRRMVEEVGAEGLGDGRILAVAHAGILYAVERSLEGSGDRLANLDGRFFEVSDEVTEAPDGLAGAVTLGERIQLLERDDATYAQVLGPGGQRL